MKSLWRGKDLSHRFLVTMIVITAVVFVAFYLIGYEHPFSEDPDFIEPLLTPVLLGLMILVVVLAVGVTLWAVFVTLRKRKGAPHVVDGIPVATISMTVTIVTVVIMILAFLLGSSSALKVNGDVYADPKWLRVADMFVISSIALMCIATAVVAIASIRTHLKNRKK